MAKRVSVDSWLFTVTLILVFLGLVMVFSASAVMAKERYGSGYYFLLRQVGWAVGGIAGHGGSDEDRLPPLQASRGRIFVVGRHHADADLGLFSRSRPQYASLDSFQRLFIPAVGSGQGRGHPVSRVLPGEPHQLHE